MQGFAQPPLRQRSIWCLVVVHGGFAGQRPRAVQAHIQVRAGKRSSITCDGFELSREEGFCLHTFF
jgi:hypothetical protein